MVARSSSSGARYDDVRSFLDAVAAEYEALPKQLRAVAKHIETNRARMVVTRITDVAAACAVQPSAVTRFAQRFGFSGYSELQALFRKAFSDHAAPGANYAERIRAKLASGELQADPGGVMRQLLLANQGAIEECALHLDDRALERAVKLLHDAEHVYVAGVRRALPAAAYLAYLLQHTSKRVELVSGLGGMFAGQIRAIRKSDLLVAISFAPYGKETRFCVRVAEARRARILALTDSAMSPIARAATAHLLVKEASAFSFRSLTNTMCLCQGLFISLASRLELDLATAPEHATMED
ncbi:MurR/RpiR family transcriptional regulator [Anaeromyxobacter oryzae]|uniref:Transcriptional regulator n=1 Tax=Anaeromyxobacter oryzae TaxID=2918170 RepID=A0ABM7X0S0_9BACT|nr:MurR/RpiR family transcriptional regulator [Anaeromyxobacter oryzae]BDG05405.1 transcriptional regulator [Anaeromyxobacter oryzae]